METLNLTPVLQKIATGPHLSKNLGEEEAYRAMQSILRGDVHDVQSGIFFIALRMKRETADEMAGIFRAILDDAPQQKVRVPALITLADQYAGYARGLPASPFIPAVLSALQVPSVIHSPITMAPKYGLTALSVLKAAGVSAADSMQSAASTLETNSGWVVIDQAVVTPHLARLNPLRDLMVKRPCLSTIECCVQPFQAEFTNTLVTGYVHKPYPPIYAMCANIAGFDNAVFVRGVEGGIVPSLAQVSRYFPWRKAIDSHAGSDTNAGSNANDIVSFENITLNEVPIEPVPLGIVQQARANPWPEQEVSDQLDAAKACATLGMSALQGEAGVMRDAIRLGAAVAYCAHISGLPENQQNASSQNGLKSALASVDAVLSTGEAWHRFNENRTL